MSVDGLLAQVPPKRGVRVRENGAKSKAGLTSRRDLADRCRYQQSGTRPWAAGGRASLSAYPPSRPQASALATRLLRRVLACVSEGGSNEARLRTCVKRIIGVTLGCDTDISSIW